MYRKFHVNIFTNNKIVKCRPYTVMQTRRTHDVKSNVTLCNFSVKCQETWFRPCGFRWSETVMSFIYKWSGNILILVHLEYFIYCFKQRRVGVRIKAYNYPVRRQIIKSRQFCLYLCTYPGLSNVTEQPVMRSTHPNLLCMSSTILCITYARLLAYCVTFRVLLISCLRCMFETKHTKTTCAG